MTSVLPFRGWGQIFTIPGLYNSGPGHWQTHWENEFGYTRIEQKNWETPVCSDWMQTIDESVMQYALNEVILVGHSLACCTIVRWAKQYGRVIKGTLLVGPSDVDAPNYPPGTSGFAPMPLYKLSFPSIVVASSNDEYVSLERARYFADSWGSECVNAGDLGHINSSSDLGNWPFGISLLQKLVQS
ncbi:MAG: RBBP9/YdeN family alpha/beta hydrolase [Chitinophagaceae bacterium]